MVELIMIMRVTYKSLTHLGEMLQKLVQDRMKKYREPMRRRGKLQTRWKGQMVGDVKNGLEGREDLSYGRARASCNVNPTICNLEKSEIIKKKKIVSIFFTTRRIPTYLIN